MELNDFSGDCEFTTQLYQNLISFEVELPGFDLYLEKKW